MEDDRSIFENSGGGVTVSGGEPMVQFPFLLELVKALSEKGFHITLQTNLNAAWNKYQALLLYVNYWMCDLKLLDSEAHRYWTGTDNRLILENIRHLDVSGVSYCLRTPVIPGVNNKKEQLQQMSDFASGLHHLDYYELLPFHPLASYKYKDLGMEYEFETVKEIPATEFVELKKKFEVRN
jgi:pyruvate formate lyase activating enzyme